MQEEWRDVVGYEGLYQVSNLGRCKSLEKPVVVKGFQKIHLIGYRKEKILSDKRRNTLGYIRLNLSKEGVFKQHYLHRLVAEAFIPNPENKPRVDHIDTNILNNKVSNLRWVTDLENNNNVVTLKNYLKRKDTLKRYYYKDFSAVSVADKRGINISTFYRRVKDLGWSIEKALEI